MGLVAAFALAAALILWATGNSTEATWVAGIFAVIAVVAAAGSLWRWRP